MVLFDAHAVLQERPTNSFTVKVCFTILDFTNPQQHLYNGTSTWQDHEPCRLIWALQCFVNELCKQILATLEGTKSKWHMHPNASINVGKRMQLKSEAHNYAKVSASSADSPKEVWVHRRVCRDQPTICKHYVYFKKVVDNHAKLSFQEAVPTLNDEAAAPCACIVAGSSCQAMWFTGQVQLTLLCSSTHLRNLLIWHDLNKVQALKVKYKRII
mmetsp:Transcript_85356/g.164341  ORF Transcript_85356/g.164341 Transcript_85356/m.164341 type:complete len:214 (-) Transcript_85356:460-1101(-)